MVEVSSMNWMQPKELINFAKNWEFLKKNPGIGTIPPRQWQVTQRLLH